MDRPFGEMIATLVEAQIAVGEAVDAHEHQLGSDHMGLRQLAQTVRSLSHQTDSLLLLMVERNAPEPLLERVEDLFDFFREVQDRTEVLLATARRTTKARGQV